MLHLLSTAWHYLGVTCLVAFILGSVSLAISFISDWLQTVLKPKQVQTTHIRNKLTRHQRTVLDALKNRSADPRLSTEDDGIIDDMPSLPDDAKTWRFTGVEVKEVDGAFRVGDSLPQLQQPEIITTLEAITRTRDELKKIRTAYAVIVSAQLPFSNQTHDELKTIIQSRIADHELVITNLTKSLDDEYNV